MELPAGRFYGVFYVYLTRPEAEDAVRPPNSKFRPPCCENAAVACCGLYKLRRDSYGPNDARATHDLHTFCAFLFFYAHANP